jgi:hypothetical protein
MARCWGVVTYKLKSPRQPASTARCWCCLWAVKRSPPPLKHRAFSSPITAQHCLSIFLHAPHASMRTGVSCPHRTLHRIYRAIAGAAPPADNNTAARGIRARIYLGASWPSKSPLPWLLGGPLQRARRSHVTCLALAGSVRARPAGGRWRAFFWHVAHSGIHFNRPQCRFGLKWLDLDHPRCPTCMSWCLFT